MATVNYSIPDEVKELFNTAFAGANRSGVISELMRRAAEQELSLKRRREAADVLLAEHGSAPRVSRESIRAARDEVRH
jgi:hypothetical protein